MHKATRILETLASDPSLQLQLRQNDLSAFEKLNLRFDELYAERSDPEYPCGDMPTCLATCSGATDWRCQL